MSIFDNYQVNQAGQNYWNQGTQPTDNQPLNQSNVEVNQGGINPLSSTNNTTLDWGKAEVDNATPESYQEYNLGLLHGDPNTLRKRKLESASIRNQRILAGDEAYKQQVEDIDLGLTPQEKYVATQERNRINTLSGDDRVSNYDNKRNGNAAQSFDDYEFDQDINTKDFAYLEGKYGKRTAEYAYAMRRDATVNSVQAGSRGIDSADTDFLSWNNLTDSALAIGAKAADTVGSLQDLGQIALQGEDGVRAVASEDNIWDNVSEFLRSKQSIEHQNAQQREQAKQVSIANQEQQDIQALTSQGNTQESAEFTARTNRTINDVMSLFDEKSTLFTQAAEIAGDLVVGGIVARGADMLAKGATNAVVKGYVEKQLKERIKDSATSAAAKVASSNTVRESAKQTANNAVGSVDATTMIATKLHKGGNVTNKATDNIVKAKALDKQNEVTKRLTERFKDTPKRVSDKIGSQVGNLVATGAVAVHGGNQEAMGALKDGYSLVADMDNNTFANTTKGKEIINELNQKYKVNSLEEGLQNSEYVTALNQVKEDLAVDASIEAYKNTFGSSAAIGALTSGVEKRIGGVNPVAKNMKEYVKNYLGGIAKEGLEEFVESASGDYNPKAAANKVVDTTVYDPTETTLASGIKGTILAAMGTGGIGALPLGKRAATVAKNKATEKIVKNKDKKASDNLQSETTSIYGTSAYTDKEGKTVSGTKGVLSKTFDETEFGKAYKEIAKEIESNAQLKAIADGVGGVHNYTKVIEVMYDNYSKNLEELSKPDLSEERKKSLEDATGKFEFIQAHLNQAVQKDVIGSSKELTTLVNRGTELSTEYANPETSPERKAKLEEEFIALKEAYAKAVEDDKAITTLFKSKFGQMLTPEKNISHKEVADLPSDVSFLDGVDKAKKNDLPTIFNSVSTGIKEVTTQLEKGKITEEQAYTAYNNAVKAVGSVMETDASSKDKLNAVKDLFNEMRSSLHSIGRDYGDSSVHAILHRELERLPSNISENAANTFLRKFIGGKGTGSYSNKYFAGLLDYINSYREAKQNGTPFLQLGSLLDFQRSQTDKLNAIQEMIMRMQTDIEKGTVQPSYSYDTKFTTLGGETNTFPNIVNAKAYANLVRNDLKAFSQIVEALVSDTAKVSTKPIKPANKVTEDSKPNVKAPEKASENISKQTEPTTQVNEETPEILLEEELENNPEYIDYRLLDFERANDFTRGNETIEDVTETLQNQEETITVETVDEAEVDSESNTINATTATTTEEEVESNVEPKEKVNVLFDVQAKHYEVTRNHLLLTFSEMTDRQLQLFYGNDVLTDTTEMFNVPVPEGYKGTPANSLSSVKDGVITVRIPTKVIANLASIGFDLTENTFSKYYKAKENTVHNPILTQTLLKKDFSNKDIEEISNGTFDETNESNITFVQALSDLTISISNYFSGQQANVFLRQKQSGTETSPRFTGFSFLSHFVRAEQSQANKGNLRGQLPLETIQGLSFGLAKGIIEAVNKGITADIRKEYGKEGKLITAVYDVTDSITQDFQYQSSAQTEENLINDYSNLSTSKRDLIKQLGIQILNTLGVKPTNKADTRQYDNLAYSVGLEGYNYLLTNGAIREYRAEIFSNGSTSIETFAGFTWNEPSIFSVKQKINLDTIQDSKSTLDEKVNAVKSLSRDNTLRTKANDKRRNEGESKAASSKGKAFSIYGTKAKINPNMFSIMNLKSTYKSDAGQVIFGDTKDLEGVTLQHINELIGKDVNEPRGQTAQSRDAKVKLTTGNNKLLKKAIQHLNDVPHTIDPTMHHVLTNHEEVYALLSGDIPEYVDIDTLPITDESKESLKSRSSRVKRSIDLLHQYTDEAIAKFGSTSNAIFTFSHKLAANSRLILSAALNPLTDKIVREHLNPVQFDLVQNEDGTSSIKGTIVASWELDKSNEPRSVLDLINQARKGDGNNINEKKALVLAIAQATGVKIESLTEERIYAKLENTFTDSFENASKFKKLTDIIDLLWEVQQSDNLALTKVQSELLQDFYNNNGTASSRLAKTLMAVGRYQYQNTSKDKNKGKGSNNTFDAHLYLEADGIANGFYNILRQFSTSISSTYLEANARTGNITLEMMAHTNDTDIKNLEGSRHIFSNLNVADMYQHISNNMFIDIKYKTSTLQSLFTAHPQLRDIFAKYARDLAVSSHLGSIADMLHILDINPSDRTSTQQTQVKFALEVHKYIKGLFSDLESEDIKKRAIRGFKNNLFSNVASLHNFGQILLLGGVDKKNATTFYNNLFVKGDFSAVNTPDNIKAFERALSKLGVTPAMYGGGLTGITNQVLTSLSGQVLPRLDSLLKTIENLRQAELDVSDIEPIFEQLERDFTEARLVAQILGIDSSLFTSNGKVANTAFMNAIVNRDIESILNNQQAIQDEVNRIAYNASRRNNRTSKLITDGLGQFLTGHIRNAFKEHFTSLKFVMAGNKQLFNTFLKEFATKYVEKVKERNKDDSLTPAEKTLGLPKKDVTKLLQELKNVPIVGTAFSSNNELVDSLVNLGNTLMKEGTRQELDGSTTLSTMLGIGSKNRKVSQNMQAFDNTFGYEAAGASLNTSVVPSTEAMTLNLVQQALHRVGKAFLNVFDGLDANYLIKDEVGKLANQETHKVHTDTNLLESLFEQMNRSTLLDSSRSKDKMEQLSAVVTSLDMMLSLEDEAALDFRKDLDSKGSYRLVQLVVDAYMNQEFINILSGKGKPNLNDILVTEYRNMSIGAAGLNDSEVLDEATKLFTTTSDALLNPDYADKDAKVSGAERLHKIMLNTFADLVASNYAIRQLEANDLPIIINQFGGSTTGYFHNEELLNQHNNVLTRYRDFLDNLGENSSAKALALFIRTDVELSGKYKKYKADKRKQLKLNTIVTEAEESLDKATTVEQLVRALSKLPNDSTQYNVANVVAELTAITKALPANTPIYRDLNEFGKAAVAKFGLNTKGSVVKAWLNKLMQGSKGKYLTGVGIYIAPDMGVDTYIHELVHALSDNVFSLFYSANRESLPNEVIKAMNVLEHNAKTFAKAQLNEADMGDISQKLRDMALSNQLESTEVIDSLIQKYDPVRVTAAAVEFAFNELPNLADIDADKVFSFQNAALQEFNAYSLSEANMLRELSSRGGQTVATKLEKLNVVGLTEKQIKKASRFYRNVVNDTKAILGLNNTVNSQQYSLLTGILSSYGVIARFNKNPITFGFKQNMKTNINEATPTTLPDIRNSVDSNTHESFLHDSNQKLLNSINSNTELQTKREVELEVLNQANINTEALQLVSDLRSVGLPMTQMEEDSFLLHYAANKVALNGNKDLEQAGYKWLEELSGMIDANALNMTPTQFSRIFNPMRSTANKLAYVLSLVHTNKDLRNRLDAISKQPKSTKLGNKIKQSLAYTKNYTAKLSNADFVKGADILSDSVSLFNLRDSKTVEQQLNQQNKLELDDLKRQEVADMFGSLTSEHVATLLKGLQSGQGTSPQHNDMNSMFTQAVMDWLGEYDKSKGKRTHISNVLRLIVGSTSKTYQWYKAKNQKSTLLESVRERTSKTVPKGIRDKFASLSKLDKEAIDTVLLPTNLHKVKSFAGVQNKELEGILTSKRSSDFEKAKVSSYLLSELVNEYGQKEGTRKHNQLMWQIEGLGELMVTKQAKTSSLTNSHYIMPNTRAIAHLIGLDSKYQEAIDSLTSIYALDYVPSESKQRIAKLLTEQTEAFNELLDSVEVMYAKSSSKDKTSLLGEDGFVMNHKDPMSNVHIVEAKDVKTLSELRRRGYTEKAKLPTGHIVMGTNMDDSVRFTTGMFNLTESSINGVNVISGMSIGSKALKENLGVSNIKIPANVMMAAGANSNYYSNLKEATTRRPIIDSKGNIVDMAIDLPRSLERDLIESTENGIDAIGNYFGRAIEEDTAIESNKHSVDLLRQHYAKRISDRKYYVNFDGKFEPKGTDIRSIKFAEEMNNIYLGLPLETKQYIESTGGVMVDIREVENILGYKQASISDIWNDRSKLPKPVQNVIKGVFEVMAGTVGYNPLKLALTVEKGASEWAAFTKDIILNKSLIVPASNLLSNTLHLWTAGVPPHEIVPLVKEGLQLAKDYQKTSNNIAQIEFMLLNHKLTTNERVKLTNELQVHKEKLLKSDLRPLVDNGIYNSVTSLEIGDDSDKDFTLWNRFSRKVGLDKVDSTTNDLLSKKVADAVLIRKGSPTHNFMTQTMDYGDFVAKYALYKHLTKNKGVDATNAMETIRDEFVNYTMNRGREFDYLNRVGLTWFLSYKLSIQKVIFRNLRRNFLRTLATYGVGKALPNNNLLDKTVIEQNLLFDSSLDYQLSPSNIYKGGESYIWYKMLE